MAGWGGRATAATPCAVYRRNPEDVPSSIHHSSAGVPWLPTALPPAHSSRPRPFSTTGKATDVSRAVSSTPSPARSCSATESSRCVRSARWSLSSWRWPRRWRRAWLPASRRSTPPPTSPPRRGSSSGTGAPRRSTRPGGGFRPSASARRSRPSASTPMSRTTSCSTSSTTRSTTAARATSTCAASASSHRRSGSATDGSDLSPRPQRLGRVHPDRPAGRKPGGQGRRGQ